MPLSPFALKPFVPAEPENFGITGSISRDTGVLQISFSLSGPLHHFHIPLPAAYPERRDNLWKESCFEFFFAEVDSEAYREVNIAPSGHWNVYRFSSCRQGMHWEEKITALACRVVSSPHTFTLEATLDLRCLCPLDKPKQVGICAVLLSETGSLSHWALVHPSKKPDFHDRKGFILTL